MPDVPASPEPPRGVAAACASPAMLAAVISPPKSESARTFDHASESARVPPLAETLVATERARTTEPFAGYANAPSNATAPAGAASTRVPVAARPGTSTWIAQARAVEPAGCDAAALGASAHPSASAQPRTRITTRPSAHATRSARR